MIAFTVLVKNGNHSRVESIEAEELGAEELARATELAHEMLAHLEAVARMQASQRRAKARDA